MRKPPEQRMQHLLQFLYGEEMGSRTYQALKRMLDAFEETHPHLQSSSVPFSERLTQQDHLLITYGDQVRTPDEAPLHTLYQFLKQYTGDFLRGVHLLPFFPYSSDDGFSVIDYRKVNPALGTWEDIRRFRQHFRLMVDAVINHVSRHSPWFEWFICGKAPYRDFFIVVDPDTDLSQVVRPRTTPLLTPVETVEGVKYVWTTFSPDQIDLNYHNPQVLLEIIRILLFYVSQGAEIIRLDAIAYLWKEIGTPCIHLPQTHAVVKLFRAIFDRVAPGVLLLTETNVPHEENISYFGDGTDEAQMVYQFSLPPLVMHTFLHGDARTLQQWAATLSTPSDETTFFNFLASHDGIGLRPAEGLLTPEEIQRLVDVTLQRGGFVSYRSLPDGGKAPYELNITYYEALNDLQKEEPLSLRIARFMAAHAIMFSLEGVPGIYFHSLIGSLNWREGVGYTGHFRTINRQKFLRSELEARLHTPDSREGLILERMRQLLHVRSRERAFHPNSSQHILSTSPALFGVLRIPEHPQETVSSLVNVTPDTQHIACADALPGYRHVEDLLSGEHFLDSESIPLPPYAVRWLKPLRA